MLGAVEHQVLEQMRKSRATRPLILAAHVVPDVHGDDRRLVILVHDEREPVGQHMLGVRDIDRSERIARGDLARQSR
jgi:hypothetical protein